jgi:hypothetical protein
MARKTVVGYVCGRGHFVFTGEVDEDYCRSHKIADIVVVHDRGVRFRKPFERKDKSGHVWYSSSGYSHSDYADDVQEALMNQLHRAGVESQ